MLLTESLRYFTLQVEAPWRSSVTRREEGTGPLSTPDRLFEGALFYGALIFGGFAIHFVVCLKWDLAAVHMVLRSVPL